ncbi:MAG: beta-eliminating lyase-related protein [Roseovarius sp.]|nr:beta-eliminating lyase-related protein [Roseovarius sp.]MCY4293071.1 beta-eliminating lyase-related protein [Roseovarius sp.]MCY4314502.1 beta-eliminating lyase-related protein [Roseovarius sp.]
MFFASDNCGPAHPEIMRAMSNANKGHMPSYGADNLMEEVRTKIRTLFEAPDADVHLVATGTAANALALSSICRPWQTVFCTPMSHINTDECHAPEFFTGGSKLTLVGNRDKMNPSELHRKMERLLQGDVHLSQRGPLALTQVTEMGSVYSLDELAALTSIAGSFDLPTYLDGARFSNAIAALDCTPAEMSWKSGIDVISMGGTKNGCIGVEAIILFDPSMSWEFELRRKRAAHLFSKHRYLSAQMLAYLENDLWLTSARQANALAARLVEGLRTVAGCRIVVEPQANIVFARLPRATHRRLHEKGAVYGLFEGPLNHGDPDELLLSRLVCDWSISEECIDRFIAMANGQD